MTAESKGRDLFIVDNSVSGWTARLRYLRNGPAIAKAFDIATGYFEIGAAARPRRESGRRLEKVRILMGAETTHRTRKALLERGTLARRRDPRQQHRDRSKPTPSSMACPASCRRSRRGRSSVASTTTTSSTPKAYITHAKLERGRLAGVGRVEQLHRPRPHRRTSS